MTTCRHCGARLYNRPGSSGRYALTTRADGTDTLGSGSECPANEEGHELACVPTALDFPCCLACQMWRDAGASWPRPCKRHYGGEPRVA